MNGPFLLRRPDDVSINAGAMFAKLLLYPAYSAVPGCSKYVSRMSASHRFEVWSDVKSLYVLVVGWWLAIAGCGPVPFLITFMKSEFASREGCTSPPIP